MPTISTNATPRDEPVHPAAPPAPSPAEREHEPARREGAPSAAPHAPNAVPEPDVDPVEEASEESFPASDPPSWGSLHTGPPDDRH